MRVYIDSVLIVYAVEQTPQFALAVEAWLLANTCDLVSSELGRMECLIVPVRNNDTALIADFEDYFLNRVAELLPLTRAVFDRAVTIRATTRIKTPDALHLAAAVEAGCDLFLTNDAQLASFTGIRVELI
jgi:predicted nucleic acid-binding protein